MGIIRINFDNNFGFGTLDPVLSDNTATSNVLHSLYVGLFYLCDGKQVPGLVESWEVKENNTRYLFRLRETLWSDGRPVTAHDFKHAWLRVIQSDSPTKHFMSWISNVEKYWDGLVDEMRIGITVIDDLTLEVTLDKPCPFFLSLTATVFYLPLPTHAIDRIGYVCNGLYQIEHFEERVVLLHPRSGSADLPKIQITCNGDEQWIEDEFRAGRLDISDGVPPFAYEDHLQRGELLYTNELGVFYLQFQCSEGVFRDPDMRRYVRGLIDIPEMVDFSKIGDDQAKTVVPWNYFDQPLTSGLSEKNDNIKRVTEPMTIRVLVNNLDIYLRIGEILKTQIEKSTPWKVEVETFEWEDFLDRLYKGDFDVALNGWVADYMDPLALLEIWQTGVEYNFSKYSNPMFDELLLKSSKEEPKKRFELLRKAESLLLDEAPLIPIYFYRLPIMRQPWIQNIHVSPFGIIQYDIIRIQERSETYGL